MSAGQVIQRLQDLETVVVKQLDRALSQVQNGIALCRTTVTATIGQVVDTRVLGENRQGDWQRKCMTQVELRDESLRWGRQAAVKRRVEFREQYGRGDQGTAWSCAVVCRPDHVVHGKRLESHRKCSTRLKYEGVATSFSGVFPERRCKVDVDSGSGSFVAHERCDGRSWRRNGRRRDLEEVIQRCFREFSKKQGLRVRVLVLREMSHDAAGPRHVTVEGSEGSRQQRKEQERAQVVSQEQPSERIRSKQRRDEIRRHGERRSECAGDRISVVARE